MAVPRDKFITESNIVLGNFITTAATLGMPVAILHKVQKDYSVVFKHGSGTDHIKPFWNDLVLYEDTVQGLRQPGSRWASEVSVQTLYHEATHAVIDIDDVDENGLFKEAMFLYKKAKLTNGSTVDDPERVAQEAAGCYVGHRAACAWQIFPKIDLWNAILDKLETKELKVDRAHELLSMTTNGTSIPEFYERKMQERVFGYQDVGSSQVSVANYPIPHLLKVYCDSVLENKISDTFAQMWQFEPRYERLKARLAGQGFQEKP